MEQDYVPSLKQKIPEFSVDYIKLHKAARKRVLEKINIKTGVIFLKGGVLRHQYDTDREELFRQESNFQ